MTHARDLESQRPHFGRGTFALVTLGFWIFVLYGSLVPFHYKPLSWEETSARWAKVRARPLGIDSRTDFATNVLLFIPLSFLLIGTFAVRRRRMVAVLAALVVIPCCSALSAAIEFTQLWFPPRVSSMNDVLAETIGAVLGALLWIGSGRQLTTYVESVWIAWGPSNLAVKLLPGYLFFLVFIHVMPLDLTISPAEIYHKWKQGRVVLVPFTGDYGSVAQSAFQTIWNMLYFAPLGWLLSLWPRRLFASSWRVLAGGALIAATVKFLQLFVLTRYCDVTDIMTGTAAVWLTWRLATVWQARRPGGLVDAIHSHRGGVRVGLFLAWFLVLAVVSWYPFNVLSTAEAASPPRTRNETAQRKQDWVLSDDGRTVWKSHGSQTFAVRTLGPFIVIADSEVVKRRWQATPLVPLVDLFPDTEYHAFDELVRKTLLFVPLGVLLVSVTGKSWHAVWRALVAGFCLASLFEAGQLLVPPRVCSTSDVLFETSGAILGFIFFRRLLILMAGRTSEGPTSPAKVGEGAAMPVGPGVFLSDEFGR